MTSGSWVNTTLILPFCLGGIWGGFRNITAARMGWLVVSAWSVVVFLSLWPLRRRNLLCLAKECHPLLFFFFFF